MTGTEQELLDALQELVALYGRMFDGYPETRYGITVGVPDYQRQAVGKARLLIERVSRQPQAAAVLCEQCGAEIKLPRTHRQREILDYYHDFIRRRGHTPSYAQMARYFGLGSKTTIAKHLKALRRLGLIGGRGTGERASGDD